VDPVEAVQVEADTLGFEIEDLAAHHAGGAGAPAQFADCGRARTVVEPQARRGGREDAAGMGDERKAGRHGRLRAEDAVGSGTAPTEVVVVHAGQVVVDQRVRVHELDGGGGAQARVALGIFDADGVGCGEA
jgi:hypothetical protein